VEPAKLTELPAWASAVLDSARVAHLGIVDDEGAPRVLAVTFAIAEGRLWSAIDEKPKRTRGEDLARVRFLRRDPRAALTVDRYDEDWRRLAWVQVLGRVDVLDAADAGPGLERLVAKYPQYRAAPPPGPVLALTPKRCLFWRAQG
jgi:PPOX class probable F420-dependent enzyme